MPVKIVVRPAAHVVSIFVFVVTQITQGRTQHFRGQIFPLQHFFEFFQSPNGEEIREAGRASIGGFRLEFGNAVYAFPRNRDFV